MDEAIEFQWNPEEALKLLDRGYRIILTKDGLGAITAIAVKKGASLNRGLRDWSDQDYNGPGSFFRGPNKFSGCGHSVAEALHCLTEKAVFNRLPDGKGGFLLPP